METPRKTPAKEKVLDAAYYLFYEQGYHATTVDQIIARSGVSKPTVYTHFSTKEDLCVAYLRDRSKKEQESLQKKIEDAESAEARYMAVIRNVKDRLIATNYRGCPFFNMVSELADYKSPIVQEAKAFVESFTKLIFDQVKAVKESHPKYKNMDVDKTAKTYYLIVCGAIMAAQEYQETWPLDLGINQIESMLEVD